MKRYSFASILALIFIMTSAATAQQNAPQSFVYQVKTGAGGGSMDSSFNVTINSVSADGTRNATLVFHQKMSPIDGKHVDATISRAGAITVASTGQMPTGGGYSAANLKAMSDASIAPMMQTMINPLNTFASGFEKAPLLKEGATWQAFSNDMQADITYTVTGREQRAGRDTFVVTMKGASSIGMSVAGQGNYDPVAHLVVGVHSEVRQGSDTKMVQTNDVAMINP